MTIGNTKWVLFNLLPYEYKALENYLEEMALKGWKLKNMRGYLLKFKRIEPKKIKYSVDIMDKISFFDGKNSESALEYREYCKAAGWEFVCEREKIQIYCSESDLSNNPIHTDEEEKFNCIFKASLKYVLSSLIIILSVGFTQYISTFGSYEANFLANDMQIFLLFILSIFIIHGIIGVVNFVIWGVKGKSALKKGEVVSYNCFKAMKIRLVLNNISILLMLSLIIYMGIIGEAYMLKVLVVTLLATGLLSIIMNFISRSNCKDKKTLNILVYVIFTVVIFIGLNTLIFSEVFSKINSRDSKIEEENYPIVLNDFNDKSINDEGKYIDEKNGVLASRLYYSVKGEKIDLSYDLFESNYKWTVEYAINKKMKWLKEINIKYIKKETNLPSEIQVYKQENRNTYLMISDNKIIEINDWNEILSEDELLNKFYEKVFKE
ncbi:DUF2812 domain-containing protein [Clostridium chauvoei]|uniref:DUF2812 domain-containing protein n=2 Tax=Clostridium chauvoei TaxID=46867 RepID=A0A1U6J3S3_9CLOT|nr:DUF2812 domain-containing protein [Clostridium chauvoei]ATD54551.1 hypothetical protein BTM20_04600 [Clostridium chauvoei]ATD57767.1 hypothetical protein BTM21_08460 [Clostridium chauvoei]MBX7281549.1 DUF2812 domain-containing protein [Clostridium chauvoei]MBX7284069.1 DUF2812 domain-containing protein [Clostridium chauvoei]MBX7286597.1 DUF2812 domain-containing protein [Clostridium chauvoei]